MLEYQNAVFLDIFEEDGLVVMAKGLGLESIISSLLKVYCDNGNLVLIIGATQKDEDFYIKKLKSENVEILPKVVTSEYAAAGRDSLYLEGGVLFVTSRILVVDLLKKKIPIERITGILVFRAHKVIDSCQEAFILRLFREENKTGFIKGFTSNPESFSWGFCKVERVMRNLFVKKLFIWPRFHATVNSTLECHKSEVVEIQLTLTKLMLAIQMALLDLISICVRELKSDNPTLDLENVSAENAISKAFDKIVRLQLEPISHQLSSKTKCLINDLKELRGILINLTQYDCVTFFNVVKSLLTAERAVRNPGWVFHPAANSLFLHSRERVFGPAEERVDGKKKESAVPPQDQTAELHLEENPKWAALKEILSEILEETKKQDLAAPNATSPPVLIATADDRTCEQIEVVLSEGSNKLLQRLCEKYLNHKGPTTSKRKKTDKDKNKMSSSDSGVVTLTQIMRLNNASEGETSDRTARSSDETLPENKGSSDPCVISEPLVLIQPIREGNGPLGMLQTLNEWKPRFILVYDMDVTFIRQLEVYKASNPNIPVVVYIMVYDSSAEEQRYLSALRREMEAFEMLIRQKGTMVIPEERDGRIDGHPDLERDPRKANETVNSAMASTRKGGGEPDPNRRVQQKIIVDKREFRSELPSMIHRRGIDIEPVTLEVGDYILTPDICVERKSVDDLIGSLDSGRLYSQATAMCRYYKKPVLLIEFNPEKPFMLQSKYGTYGQASSHDTKSKLVLLTLHFPKLKIIWCTSPHATAEIFQELKVGKEQPSAEEAMKITEAVTAELGTDVAVEKYNPSAQTFLTLMPGVDSKNCRLLMNRTGSLHELGTKWSQEQLNDLLGNSMSAKSIWEGFHFSPKKTTELAKHPIGRGSGRKWRKY